MGFQDTGFVGAPSARLMLAVPVLIWINAPGAVPD